MMDAAKLEQLAREAGFHMILKTFDRNGELLSETPIGDNLFCFANLVLEEVALKLEDIDALCAEEVRAMKEKQ